MCGRSVHPHGQSGIPLPAHRFLATPSRCAWQSGTLLESGMISSSQSIRAERARQTFFGGDAALLPVPADPAGERHATDRRAHVRPARRMPQQGRGVSTRRHRKGRRRMHAACDRHPARWRTADWLRPEQCQQRDVGAAGICGRSGGSRCRRSHRLSRR